MPVPPLSADAQEAAQQPAPPWPRVITTGTKTLTIHEPQAERWENSELWATSAVSVQDTATGRPIYGVVHFKARTDVDKTQQLVSLHDVQITGAEFPADPNQANVYRKTIDDSGQLTSIITVSRLQAGLKTTEVARDPSRRAVENPLPRIIVSQVPAVLVVVDGAPVLRPLQGTSLSRVVNTRALVVHDASLYYLYLGNHWVQSTTLEGSWSDVGAPSSELDRAKSAVQGLIDGGEVDLLASSVNDLGSNAKVVVSTTPAELIQTRGPLQVAPIHGTDLWYVTNTKNDLFLQDSTKAYFAVLSGRWFRARTLDGPWQFVPAEALPSDFARIPPDSQKANVLASIPGTTQAKEALIANQIPQTAVVPRRDGPTLDVDYDGPPRFSPIEETQLQYATNTATPVLQISPTSYYAVSDGVWFTATTPIGPWVVADSVPPSVYSIPTSSPMHQVTYVYVDGASPGYVYDAYAPGYLGTVVAPSGVVVYGTGFDYSPWVGNYWYGGPWTYGYGAGLALGLGFGFAFNTAFVAPVRGPHVYVAAPYAHYGGVHLANVDVYHRWSGAGVVARGPYYGAPRGVAPRGIGGGPPAYGAVPPRTGAYPGGGVYRAPPVYGAAPSYRAPVGAPPVYHRPVGNVPPVQARPVAPAAPVYRGAPVAPPPVYRSAPIAPAPVAPRAVPAPAPAYRGGAGVPMHRPGGFGVPMHR